MIESRFPIEARSEQTDDPGLVLGDDGVVYAVRADGTRAAVTGVPSEELDYYADLAALLDPRAYVFHRWTDPSQDVVVPAGETWFALGTQHASVSAASTAASGAQAASAAPSDVLPTGLAAPGATTIPAAVPSGFLSAGKAAIVTTDEGTTVYDFFSYTGKAAGFTGVTGNAVKATGGTHIQQGTSTLSVRSTVGFSPSGALWFPDGTVGRYSSIVDGTTFGGCIGCPAVADGAVVIQRAGLFAREPDARNALALPAGTQIGTDILSPTYLYYCRPSLVAATDDRYLSDPRGLYYRRLQRLKTLPLLDLAAIVPFGSAMGTSVTQSFPAAGSVMVVHASLYRGSWLVLNMNVSVGVTGGLNVYDEISDDHTNRYGKPMLIPVQANPDPTSTSTAQGIRVRGGNFEGQSDTQLYTLANGGTDRAWGAIKYVVLPADW